MDYLAEIIVKFQSNPKVQSDTKLHQKWMEEWLQLEWKATFLSLVVEELLEWPETAWDWIEVENDNSFSYNT